MWRIRNFAPIIYNRALHFRLKSFCSMTDAHSWQTNAWVVRALLKLWISSDCSAVSTTDCISISHHISFGSSFINSIGCTSSTYIDNNHTARLWLWYCLLHQPFSYQAIFTTTHMYMQLYDCFKTFIVVCVFIDSKTLLSQKKWRRSQYKPDGKVSFSEN